MGGMTVEGDTSNMARFGGAVRGLLEAVDDTRYKTNFIGRIMTNLEKKFMADTIAARQSRNISHVFEWGEEAENPSAVPLFKVTRHGRGDARYMNYVFLPSTKLVPLPARSKYPINEDIRSSLRRVVFTHKALVIETQPTVEYGPRNAKALFIPTTNEPGFYLTRKRVTIKPGGASSTGAFSAWWVWWFETRAQAYVNRYAESQTEIIKKTGQRVIRSATGRGNKGSFAPQAGKKIVSFGVADGVKTRAKQEALAALLKEKGDGY